MTTVGVVGRELLDGIADLLELADRQIDAGRDVDEHAVARPTELMSSSSGLETAASAAMRARSGPLATPEPIIAMPISDITVRTSAKSTLIRPGPRDQLGDALHRSLQHFVRRP